MTDANHAAQRFALNEPLSVRNSVGVYLRWASMEGPRVATARESEFKYALKCYTVARLAFRSIADSIARRLAAGKVPTDNEILAEQEARTAIGTALRRVSATFAKP